jgi:hypothetical protein
MTKAMLNVNDKVDEKVNEEKDDVDDDDKVGRLVMKIIISKMIPIAIQVPTNLLRSLVGTWDIRTVPTRRLGSFEFAEN